MKKGILFILLMATGFLWAQSGEYGDSEGTTKVLIAYENTRFKTNLVDGLIEDLSRDGFYIKVVDHQNGELEGINPTDYDVVFITNSGVTAKVRSQVSDWLASAGQPENVIVHTTQRSAWTPAIEVDSVTSASLRKSDEIEALVKEYGTLIRNKL
jgi:hypothetical protein